MKALSLIALLVGLIAGCNGPSPPTPSETGPGITTSANPNSDGHSTQDK